MVVNFGLNVGQCGIEQVLGLLDHENDNHDKLDWRAWFQDMMKIMQEFSKSSGSGKMVKAKLRESIAVSLLFIKF